MLATAASLVRKVTQLEASAHRYVTEATLEHPVLGKLTAIIVQRPDLSWVRTEVAPIDRTSGDALMAGEPAVILEFEIVGDRNVLDVTFVGNTAVHADVH